MDADTKIPDWGGNAANAARERDEAYSRIDQVINELEQEYEFAETPAEALRLALKQMEGDREHAIAVIGTQITIGDVIRGVLAQHHLRKKEREDG